MGSKVQPFIQTDSHLSDKYNYECFRVIGFPAIVEHHVTFGVAYDITDRFSAHAGFMHAFENTLVEHGTNLAGQPARCKSSLSENSIELGLTWKF
jgi:long-chain fatty acid transport protein